MELYATGEGQTQAPLAVGIGGQEAEVLESDAFPGFVEFLRVKVHIPKEVAPGPAVPIVLSIGEARSQDGEAVAVK